MLAMFSTSSQLALYKDWEQGVSASLALFKGKKVLKLKCKNNTLLTFTNNNSYGLFVAILMK